jgi:hypothetical protein
MWFASRRQANQRRTGENQAGKAGGVTVRQMQSHAAAERVPNEDRPCRQLVEQWLNGSGVLPRAKRLRRWRGGPKPG